ncbi:hypothetical protein NM208_g9706 [Fusarium decemcellulare]|uniref:Uncharacterized protein n=1 Tax=Fusarium decemcellulare TaxID=57161 RepID=A0ACC1S0J7_9HYPO|nr:hypothetical protein NM208_g9706 [Fusarium decemcellulare]
MLSLTGLRPWSNDWIVQQRIRRAQAAGVQTNSPDDAQFANTISPLDPATSQSFDLGSAESPVVAPFLAPTPLNSAELNTTMAIPLSHSTTTGNLLRSAPARALLGDYPQDIFLHIELGRSIPTSLSLTPKPLNQIEIPAISRDEADELVHTFFTLVHRFYPILDEGEFRRLYDDVFTQDLSPNLATAIVLIVLALGSVSDANYDASTPSWEPGSRFSSPAISILLTVGLESFGSSLLLPQSLYLAAVYYSFLARPLQAWRLVHMASTDVQHYWIRQLGVLNAVQEAAQDQLILRLCWAIFILECDIVAEHHFPRSGIENIVEKLPFPGFGNSPTPPMLRWLANISSRRLLNRIHYVLYDTYQGVPINTDSSGAPTSQFGISQELNHQLHAWYDLLPAAIKPDLEHDGHGLDDAILLMRFHAAGDIIYRPFLLQVCALSAGETPDARMMENAKRCLYHCRGYLNAVQGALTKPSASLEVFIHSTMAVVLLLTFASFSPALASEVGDVKQLQAQATASLQSWSFPESSIETMLSIVRTVRVKCLGR